MTKEELAKKNGIKTRETNLTAAETLITKSIKEKSEKNEKNEKPVSSKAGRPKGKPSKKISLNIPDEYMEMVEIASAFRFKGNTTSYIVSLIENDIEANREVYEQIKKITG